MKNKINILVISTEVKFSDIKVSECKNSFDNKTVNTKTQNGLGHDTIYASAVGDSTLKVRTTNTLFSCCASEIRLSAAIDTTTIAVTLSQSEDGAQCNCLCGRSIEFLLSSLKEGQEYSVSIKKDIFEYYSFDFTFSGGTNLTFNF